MIVTIKKLISAALGAFAAALLQWPNNKNQMVAEKEKDE